MNHLLTLDDLTAEEMDHLYTQARMLKLGRRSPTGMPPLTGQTIALLFEKPSLRTRVSFEGAALELGAQSLYRRAFAGVEQANLDKGAVGVAPDLAAQDVDLFD